MSVLLRFVGLPFPGFSTPEDGRYLESYDPNEGEHGRFSSTEDPAKAMRFEDVAAALACYRQVNRRHPLRPDGKPNRPLSAFTVEVVKHPDGGGNG